MLLECREYISLKEKQRLPLNPFHDFLDWPQSDLICPLPGSSTAVVLIG